MALTMELLPPGYAPSANDVTYPSFLIYLPPTSMPALSFLPGGSFYSVQAFNYYPLITRHLNEEQRPSVVQFDDVWDNS